MGYYIAFKVMQFKIESEVEQKIKSGINKSALTIFNINNDDIEWIDDKELKYNGNYYDVVESRKTSDGVILNCIRDKEEEILYATLDEHINLNVVDCKPIKNSSKKNIDDHVTELYFSIKSSFLFDQSSSENLFSPVNLIYIPALIETNILPPEFV